VGDDAVHGRGDHFTGFFGSRTPEQRAATAIRLATLPDDGPSGAFFEDEGAVPW